MMTKLEKQWIVLIALLTVFNWLTKAPEDCTQPTECLELYDPDQE